MSRYVTGVQVTELEVRFGGVQAVSRLHWECYLIYGHFFPESSFEAVEQREHAPFLLFPLVHEGDGDYALCGDPATGFVSDLHSFLGH